MKEYNYEICILLLFCVIGLLFSAFKANNEKDITDVIRYLVFLLIFCTGISILTITLLNINLQTEIERKNHEERKIDLDSSNYSIDTSNSIPEQMQRKRSTRK